MVRVNLFTSDTPSDTLAHSGRAILPRLLPQGHVSILTNSEDLRERLRKMSDHELRKFGRAARSMANPKKSFGPPNPAFQIQLDEARAEWRRRHPRP
jgi:hypothetical protein